MLVVETTADASMTATAATPKAPTFSTTAAASSICDMDTLDATEIAAASVFDQWGGWAASLAACDDFAKVRAEQRDVDALLSKLEKAATITSDDITALQQCAFTYAEINQLNSPLLDGLLFGASLRLPRANQMLANSTEVIPIPYSTFASPVVLLLRIIRAPIHFVDAVRFLLDRTPD